jgi:selenocysteine-specific translation elongation factor
MPSGKDIIVKSIQMHDDAVQESKSPARVGLAVKGINADQISRGDILCCSLIINLQRCHLFHTSLSTQR